MEVMLLAAGKGTRLGQITETVPKCLVPVAGKPMLERQLLHLKESGATKVVVNLFHLAPKVKAFFDSFTLEGVELICSEEPELYNTGGGLQYAKKHFSLDDPILVYNVDIYSSLSLPELYLEHKKNGGAATLVTQKAEGNRVLVFGENHSLYGWKNLESGEEKLSIKSEDGINRGFCGIQCVSPVIFDYLGRPEEKESIITAYLRAVENDLSVFEMQADNYVDGHNWFDIGTPDDLERFRKFILATDENV